MPEQPPSFLDHEPEDENDLLRAEAVSSGAVVQSFHVPYYRLRGKNGRFAVDVPTLEPSGGILEPGTVLSFVVLPEEPDDPGGWDDHRYDGYAVRIR